jgi:phosphoribosylformylglycinamidine synthase PurS subunit
MIFHAAIDIMPLPSLLDPQGKAVSNNMANVGLAEITEVRVGKHITLQVDANDRDAAYAMVVKACEKLLANQIMEAFTFTLEEVQPA